MAKTTRFTLNGRAVRSAGDPERMLVWVLRQEHGLTATKVGCGEGHCGACTVLVDGEPTRSCVTPLRAVAGRKVVTLEGLSEGEALHPVQQAFADHHAFQCGFCTSGMIMASVALVDRQPGADRARIVEHLDGHLCRCGAHVRILDAVAAAGRAKGGAR